MATDPAHRGVSIDRVTAGRFAARNDRGGRIAIGTGGDADFTPTELLLAALGGCTAIDVDILTSRRAEPEAFAVEVGAEKVRDSGSNHLADIEVGLIRQALDATGGVVAHAARLLHMQRTTLVEKLRKYGMQGSMAA